MDEHSGRSLRLAVDLQLQDIAEVRAAERGNPRKRGADDFEFALEIFGEELTSATLQIDAVVPAPVGDPALRPWKRPALTVDITSRSASVLKFGDTTGQALAEVTAEPLMTTFHAGQSTSAAAGVDVIIISDDEEDEEDEEGEDEMVDHDDGSNSLMCSACTEVLTPKSAAPASCSHFYCKDCLTKLFRNATTDETSFPAQCCKKQIELQDAKKWLPDELVTSYESKQVEFTTPKRLYCASKRCSTFIPPTNIFEKLGECPTCFQLTCRLCRSGKHTGACLKDYEKEEIMNMAKEKGWMKCHNCQNVVEREYGCNHMTCRCGRQFCYACGWKWKTCKCSNSDEEFLVPEAL